MIGDFHIAKSGKARSGVGLAVRGQAYRRLALGTSGVNLLGRVSGSGDLYRQPGFNQMALDVTAGPEFHLGRSSLALGVGATLNWFGGTLYTRQLHAAADLSQPIGATSLVRVHAAAAAIDNRLSDLQDGRDYSVQLTASRPSRPGRVWSQPLPASALPRATPAMRPRPGALDFRAGISSAARPYSSGSRLAACAPISG